MRIIKFRIWDKVKTEWVENKDQFGPHYINSIFTCDDNYVFQQFTGLKDHKNVDCYDGDIVRYFNLPPFEISYGLLGEVQFINGCFCIKCRDKSKGGNKTWITEFSELDYFEIIGNVCENPELLK